jgi:hypothetical protein
MQEILLHFPHLENLREVLGTNIAPMHSGIISLELVRNPRFVEDVVPNVSGSQAELA